MGFSDTATYIQSGDASAIHAPLSSVLASFGFKPDPRAPYHFVPSYHPIEKTDHLVFWAVPAAESYQRVYCSHSGIFAQHHNDFVPVLQSLACDLKTLAFEISVNDGDSMCVLETDGTRSRLTGAHSYVIDELFDKSAEMEFTPGDVYSLKGIKFPYQNLEVAAEIIPELLAYDFGFDMQEAIATFERSVFGKALPSYYDSLPDDSAMVFRYTRTV